MNRFFLTWLVMALVSAGTAFVAVRTVLLDRSRSAGEVSLPAAREPDSRSTAQLDAALMAAGDDDEALGRRMRLLELLATADISELRRMMRSTQCTRREKRAIAERWAEVDPSGMLHFLMDVSRSEWERDGDQYLALRRKLFQTWARKDPEAAMAAAMAASHRPAFRSAAWEIVTSLFATDPTRAFALSTTLPFRSMDSDIPESVWKSDPARFLKAAGEGPARALGKQQIRPVVEAALIDWVKQDLGAAAGWLATRPPDQRRHLWGIGAAMIARTDPAAARAWFATLPASEERELAGSVIVREWAHQDPRAALDWMQDSLVGGRTKAFGYIAEALTKQGVDSAKQLLEALPPGNQHDEVVSAIARTWSQKEFKPAADWVLSLPPDDPGRRRAMQQITNDWPTQDPPGAAAYVLANPNDPDARDMVRNVANHFTSNDVAGGVAWAAALPERQQRLAFDILISSAQDQNTLPKTFAAIATLPPATQSTIVERIVTDAVFHGRYNSDNASKQLVLFQNIPPELRDTARQAIESVERASPERKQAALEALK